ncbi:MAG: hypothetical protein Q8P10_00660 [bacterium]|nr:hypothetical protein [bacterium]
MEIAFLSKDCIKIKGKTLSVIIDPFTLRTKTPCDAVFLLKEEGDFDLSKTEGFRVLIKGAGEYELSSVKIYSQKAGESLVYELRMDGMMVLLGNVDGIEKLKDKLKEYDVAILYVPLKFDQNLITAIEPKAVVFYGDGAQEAVKSLNKSSENSETIKTSKFIVKPETLKEEMEVVLLG